jgi:hypothetical protein
MKTTIVEKGAGKSEKRVLRWSDAVSQSTKDVRRKK